MNTAQNHTRQPRSFVEQALARIDELVAVAQNLTETLGLPEEARYAVLSGLTPTLLEELYESEQKETASPPIVDEKSSSEEKDEQTETSEGSDSMDPPNQARA